MREQIKIVCARVVAVIRAALGGAVSSRAGYAELARRSHPRAAATLFAKVIVRPRTEGQCAEFEAAVRQVPAILSAHRLSGSGDYLLELTQEYPADLDRMKEDVLARLPGYVDCSIAVVDRTAVDPDAFLEAHAAAGAASACDVSQLRAQTRRHA